MEISLARFDANSNHGEFQFQGNQNTRSVHYSGAGYPDFTPYAKAQVRIKLTGNRGKDFVRANRAAGYSKTPEGYTWHHHQEAGLMELVPSDLHDAIRHTGGVATSSLLY